MARAVRHYISDYVWHNLLGYRVKGRKDHESDGVYQLKEPASHYGLGEANIENTHLWER